MFIELIAERDEALIASGLKDACDEILHRLTFRASSEARHLHREAGSFNPLPMNNGFDAGGIVDQLAAIYEESVANLRRALATYVQDRMAPDPAERANGCFAYPELRIDYG